jgi:hypothetical protein
VIPLFRRLWAAFWYDEMFAARWARGFLLWAGTVGMQLVSAGPDAAKTWSLGEWGVRLVVSAIVGSAGLITAGQPNPKVGPEPKP